MCGGVPFAEDAEDPYEIYEDIIKRIQKLNNGNEILVAFYNLYTQ